MPARKKKQAVKIPLKERLQRLFFPLAATGLTALVILATVLIYRGTAAYQKETRQAVIIMGLKSLEEGDVHKAETVFKKGAMDGSLVAAQYLAWLEAKQGHFNKALEYARKSTATNELFGAFEIMGDLALLGYGQAVGAGAAIFYYQEAAKAYPEYQQNFFYGRMIENAIDLCQSQSDYVRICNEAMRINSPKGSLIRGDIEFLGEDSNLSPASAMKNWLKAENGGLAAATTRRAGMQWNGYGTDRDYQQAIKLYQQADSNGDPAATYALGLILLRADQPDSAIKALRYFKRAAQAGYGPAMSAQAILTLNADRGNAKTAQAAFALFKTAHEKHDFTGSVFYSLMLYTGEGTGPDAESALAVLYDLKGKQIKPVDGLLHYLTYYSDKTLRPLFDQLIELTALQLKGDLHFLPGPTEGEPYHHAAESLNYFTPPFKDASVDDSVKKLIGKNFIAKLDDPESLTVAGKPLMFTEMTDVLVQCEPSTGALAFLPQQVLRLDPALPPLPEEYSDSRYRMDVKAILENF